MRKWIVQTLTPILCGLAFLLGLIGLGRAARASLHDRVTYSIAFDAIDCLPPEGMSREAFLNEVRAHTNQPEALPLLDEDSIARLHRAFAVHPWVDSVRCVDIGTPRHAGHHSKTMVHLDLVYRHPVLAVPLSPAGEAEKGRGDRGWRIVDRQSILLPVAAVPAHLPVLAVSVAAPAGPPGSRWGDARVAAAAKTAAFLQPHLADLHLNDSEIEITGGEMLFRRPGVRVVWGHAPGQEEKGEAPAKVKLQRLLDYQKAHDGLESLEHDVRLLAYQGHFPLAPDEPLIAVSLYEPSQIPSRRNRDHVSNSSRSWRSCFSDAKAAPTSASSR